MSCIQWTCLDIWICWNVCLYVSLQQTINCTSYNMRVYLEYYGKVRWKLIDCWLTIEIWDSYYCPSLHQLNALWFRMMDSPLIIQGLHLHHKKITKHSSVSLHNLQIFSVIIYNHYWTQPVARVHSGSITCEDVGRGCAHENSACNLFVVTSCSEHTVTSTCGYIS